MRQALPARPAMYWDPRSPVAYDAATDTWHVFGFADVLQAMSVSQAEHGGGPGPVVGNPFRRRVLVELEPRIRAIADELLDAVVRRGDRRIDVVADVARPLSLRTICLVLGLDASAGIPLDHWPAPAATESARRAFLADLIREVGRRPRLGLAGDLVAAEASGYPVNGRPMTKADLVGCVAWLLDTAHASSTALGNAVLFLTEFGALDELRANPALIPGAVEEVLRWYPPSPGRRRRLVVDTPVGDLCARAGSWIVGWTSAANRDGKRFVDPHCFDIRRSPNEHLSFGRHPTRCPGAPLVRLEVCVALEHLARRLPGLRRDPARPLHRVYGDHDALTALHCTHDAGA